MRRKSLLILTVALSLTIVSPSVYAGSQEPPIGPAPGPPKAPAEKVKPPQPKPSDHPEQKRILEPPFNFLRESSVAKPPKPSKQVPDAKADKSDRKKTLKKRPGKQRPSSKNSTSEPNQSGPMGKLLKSTDSDPRSKPATHSQTKPKSSASKERSSENSNPQQERRSKDQTNLRQEMEPNTALRMAEANPAGNPPEENSKRNLSNPSLKNQPQGASAETAHHGKTTDNGTEVAVSSAQTDRQLPRTEKTSLPKTASHGPLMIIIGLLTATVGWVGRKIGFSKVDRP